MGCDLLENTDFLLVVFWVVVAFVLVWLLNWYFDCGICNNCSTYFHWTDPSVIKGKDDKAQIADVAYVAVDNGNKRQEQVRYPLCYTYTCVTCRYVNKSTSWYLFTEWENNGDPFRVKPCPFCNGKGHNKVKIGDDFGLGWDSNSGLKLDYLQSREGKSKCGFCEKRGWVKPNKLKELIAE